MAHRVLIAVFAAALSAIAGWPSVARAATPDELIRQGVELRRKGNNEGALSLFQQALALEASARAVAQVGLAEQALGLWANAETHIEKALAQANDPWVTKNRTTLETALGTVREHIGRVEVLGEPAGATVKINGDTVGTLPMTTAAHVSSGAVDVEVTAPGYRRSSRTLTLGTGQYQKVVIRLDAVEPASTSATAVTVPPAPGVGMGAASGSGAGAGTSAGSPTTTGTGSPSNGPDSEPEAGMGRGLRPLAIGAAAVGVAAGITGTVLYILAGKKVKQIEDDIRTRGQYVEGNESWKALETTGIVLWAVGAAGVVTGVVLWSLDRRDSPSRVSLVPAVTPGRLQLAANWEF